MNLSYNDEQRLLKDSIEKFIQQEYNFEARRKIADSELGFSKEHWRTFADLGWLALPFAEEDGGLAGGAVETMILMEAFGKGLVLEPWLATVLMSGQLISRLASEEVKAEYLASIIQGESHCSLAHWEPGQRFDLTHVTTTAEKQGDHWVVNGSKQFVFNGQNADQLIVTARVSGGEKDREGIVLLVMDGKQTGVEAKGFRTLEGGRAANIHFNNAQAKQLLGDGEAALAALQHCLNLAAFSVCAEAVGIMEKLYKTTVEYTKTRKQFGVPIGKFQALQHRMVNMFILHEQSQSLLLLTALKLQEGGDQVSKAVSGLKAWIGQAGRKLGQEAIQLHGGMGMTDELDVGYYFKRLTAVDALFGNADYHLDCYASEL